MGIKEAIKSSFKDSRQMAMVNVLFTANHLRDIGAPIFKEYDILSQHYNILRIAKGKFPEPVYPGYIKEVMLDKGRDLTRLIDKLVKMELVDRRLCEENRRKVEITITPKGIELVEAISKKMEANQTYLNNLTEEEAVVLSGLLDKLRG